MNQQNKSYKVLGIMSGTSFDGIDFCLSEFKFFNNKWAFKILASSTIEYSVEWKNKILNIEDAKGADLMQLHFEYGHFLGEKSTYFLETHEETVDLIASHGHTIFHQIDRGFTFQLGHGAAIAARSAIPTVSDFRSLDVALGGEGAPLVPFGDQELFSDYKCCVNIGGIANLSFQKGDQSIAYDLAPANMVLNYLYQKEFQGEFDLDGEKSKSGKIVPDLYNRLKALPYYAQISPKSIGKEWVFENVIPILDQHRASTVDKLYTFSKQLCFEIAQAILENGLQNSVLITGGGAKNKFLMQLIKEEGITVKEVSTEIVDFKEALLFAFLGLNRYLGLENTLQSVTGASKNSCGGSVFLP